MNASNPNAGNDVVNGGLKARAEYSKESKLVTVRGKLHEICSINLDLFLVTIICTLGLHGIKTNIV